MRNIVSLLLLAVVLMGCRSVAITGRKQLNLVSDADVLSSSLTQYKSFMSSAKVSTEKVQSETVTRVGQRIAAATEKYLAENGMQADLQNYAWEFNLVKSDEINAFCMPGGKIVVYEGIMKLFDNDDELAVVLGHEVAHAVAKHSNERMSQQILQQYGAAALSIGLSGQSYAVQSVASQVYGIGSQVGVMLPFSRKHESEADYMGLVLMTMAGYNPDYAVTFWKKMAAKSGGSTNELMSTHPSDARRISDIQKSLPEIKSKYGGVQSQSQKKPREIKIH
ncbi:MAG: M48 family metallopeptidase [Bacteroidaceae bacterium]|nr:M48 family metallopeptidase [Bacteroidaceae bacterium]